MDRLIYRLIYRLMDQPYRQVFWQYTAAKIPHKRVRNDVLLRVEVFESDKRVR